LRSRVRGNGTVYRYGGDEFVVLLHPVCDLPLLDRYMRKLIDSFSAPVTVGDGVIDITVSAGVSLFPSHAGELGDGGASEILDYLEVVHVFIRRPHASGPTLLEAGQAHRGDHPTIGLPNREFSQSLASRMRAAP